MEESDEDEDDEDDEEEESVECDRCLWPFVCDGLTSLPRSPPTLCRL
jgi:hypothetical protein